MRILIDVDGVICDFVSGYCELVEGVTGRKYALADVTDYDFTAFCLSIDERRQVEHLLFQRAMVRCLHALPGSQAGVAGLAARGAEIVFVTSPWRGHPTWASEREEWLGDLFPGYPVVSTHAKYVCAGDVMIDDRPEHLQRWYASTRSGHPLLWDAPYNQGIKILQRVRSWADVYREIWGPDHQVRAAHVCDGEDHF